MAVTKYGKNFITELQLSEEKLEQDRLLDWRIRVLYLDTKVLEGAFYLSSCWYTKGIAQALAVEPHTHDCDEVLAFIGNDPTNPLDLGGEIEMWIDNEKHLINKSCLVFIPKGMNHCPMRATRVDRPIFHFSTALTGEITKLPLNQNSMASEQVVVINEEQEKAGTKYDKYFISELQFPGSGETVDWKSRVLYLDDKVLEGAFYLSSAWYTKGIEPALAVEPHTHDCDEVLAFIGNDPTDPLDLGGEIEMWIDNEKHLINKSCLVFIPKGMPHCPMRATRVDRPIFHFSTGPAGATIKFPVETR